MEFLKAYNQILSLKTQNLNIPLFNSSDSRFIHNMEEQELIYNKHHKVWTKDPIIIKVGSGENQKIKVIEFTN